MSIIYKHFFFPHPTLFSLEASNIVVLICNVQNTVVWFDLWCLGHSTQYWKDPETFDPSRFIDENGQNSKYSFLQQFGAGKYTS